MSGFALALLSRPVHSRAWRNLIFLFLGAVVVLLAIVPTVYSQPSVLATWLFALWLCWSYATLWIVVQRDFSPPALGLMAIMLQYVLIPATRAVIAGRTGIGGVDYTSGTLAALQISVAAQLALTAGLIGVHRLHRGSTELRRVTVEAARKRLNLWAIAIVAVAAAALALLTVTSGADLSKYIAITGTSSYGAFYHSASGTTSGYLGSLIGGAGACILVAVVARSVRRRGRSLFIIVLALVAAGFLISGGVRVRLVVPILAAGLLWMKIRRGRRPLAMRSLTIVAIGFTLFFGALVGVARGPGAPPITVASLVDSQFGGGSDLFAPLAGLAQTVPAQQDYLWGSSYLEALYFPVPRAIWPNKPEGAILGVTARFADVGNGESFPEYGEMYANFGLAGVVIGCLLFGAAMEWMWVRFASSLDKRHILAYPVLIAIMLQLFTRDYAVSGLAGLLGLLLGALVLQRALKVDVLQRTAAPTATAAQGGSVGRPSLAAARRSKVRGSGLEG